MTAADPGRIDPAIVAALYERHSRDLGLFLLGVLRDGELAAEALQNTFTKAIECGHTAREETLKSWLFQVAFNEAMLLRRRAGVTDRSLRHIASCQSASRASVGNGRQGPGDQLDRLETEARIRGALAKLTPEQRQVVQMRIYEDKTFATIADELATPLGTVLTRMRLALRKLSRTLRPECSDP